MRTAGPCRRSPAVKPESKPVGRSVLPLFSALRCRSFEATAAEGRLTGLTGLTGHTRVYRAYPDVLVDVLACTSHAPATGMPSLTCSAATCRPTHPANRRKTMVRRIRRRYHPRPFLRWARPTWGWAPATLHIRLALMIDR